MVKFLVYLVTFVFALALVSVVPASATTLLSPLTITTAITGSTPGPTFQFRRGSPRNLACQANFAWGSGGTTAKAWVQTSLDGGTTWTDNGLFSFTTAIARQGLNLSSLTPVTTAAVLTDGTASSSQDGVIGSLVRVKVTTTGTYAGGTTLQVDCISDNLTAWPGE